MKKVLKWIVIGFMVLFIAIFTIACMDVMNDDSEKSAASVVVEEYTEEHNFDTEKTIEILKEYIPNYEDITAIEEEGIHAGAIYCDDDLMYYIMFYLDKHPEKSGELMSIDTAEEEYENRTRLYQSY